MSTLARGLLTYGIGGLCVDVECHLSNNLPTIVISGLAGKTVNEAKDRLRGAFASSQLELPRRRITINLAPADIPKADSGLDLAMAVSILVASQQVMAIDNQTAAIGELSLDGRVRPVRGIIGKLLAGRDSGLTTYYLAIDNLAQAQLVPGITLYGVANLGELHDHLAGKRLLWPVKTGSGSQQEFAVPNYEVTFDDVVGQELAKRALTIAAAGGHNILLNGPPGTGKSMLAKATAALLPALTHEEMLEVTHLHSLASPNYERLLSERPIRSPHHSASTIAMIGGGTSGRPGEISLSHRGILFLDEFPEFSHQTLEALRQPLEDRHISVTRLKNSWQFPANFIMVATANPCPCGYYNVPGHDCSCPRYLLERYRHRLSGPIYDRIDLITEVQKVDHTRLLRTVKQRTDSTQRRASIIVARELQAERYGSATVLNGDVSSRQLRQSTTIERRAQCTLNTAANTLKLSSRAYLKIVRVSRTIADLEGTAMILDRHVSEAASYRQNTSNPLPV